MTGRFLPPRISDRIAVWVFLLAFLVPMVLRATVEKSIPHTPKLVAKLHNIACLFVTKPVVWKSYYLQVLYRGDTQWRTLDQAELFPLQPFGRRTRMHRFLIAWGGPGKRTRDLASWILTRWAELHSDEAQPIQIRFAVAWSIPSLEDPPQHGWQPPDWNQVPNEQRSVMVSYTRAELSAP